MPKLYIRSAQFNELLNNDSGSGARQDLATWRPKNLEAGWYYLGPAANNGGSGGTPGIIVKPVDNPNEPPAIVPITRWVHVWTDAGSGKPTDYALWKGFPSSAYEADYRVVGGLFTRYSGHSPTVDDARDIVAIHKDALVRVGAGGRIWTDAGTGARQDGSVWGVSTVGHVQAVETGAFLPADGHDNPPSDVYAIDRNSIIPE